jgi:hypothetical protein
MKTEALASSKKVKLVKLILTETENENVNENVRHQDYDMRAIQFLMAAGCS